MPTRTNKYGEIDGGREGMPEGKRWGVQAQRLSMERLFARWHHPSVRTFGVGCGGPPREDLWEPWALDAKL